MVTTYQMTGRHGRTSLVLRAEGRLSRCSKTERKNSNCNKVSPPSSRCLSSSSFPFPFRLHPKSSLYVRKVWHLQPSTPPVRPAADQLRALSAREQAEPGMHEHQVLQCGGRCEEMRGTEVNETRGEGKKSSGVTRPWDWGHCCYSSPRVGSSRSQWPVAHSHGSPRWRNRWKQGASDSITKLIF